jgi:hypothetical protein
VLGIGGGLLGLLFCTLHLLVFWLGAQQPAVKLLSIGQLLLAGLLIRTEPLLPFLIGINAGGWGEWLAWALLALLLLLGLWYGWRAPGQRTWLVALGSFGLAFLLLWLAILLVPALQLRGWTAVQTASTVAPYLVIWLFLPIGLCWVAWKHSRAAPE